MPALLLSVLISRSPGSQTQPHPQKHQHGEQGLPRRPVAPGRIPSSLLETCGDKSKKIVQIIQKRVKNRLLLYFFFNIFILNNSTRKIYPSIYVGLTSDVIQMIIVAGGGARMKLDFCNTEPQASRKKKNNRDKQNKLNPVMAGDGGVEIAYTHRITAMCPRHGPASLC